ncbi:hypothetical protein [Krasilnikovia sp. MM14-A1259]|uniref:hypothetical protein n=1 Tax=Krasilnikovia sp. MM14-A1259 TaxID=3373539 RepID=UPI0038127B21
MSIGTVLVPVMPQLVTGLFTIAAGLSAVVLTQRHNERQRSRDRAAAANTKIEEATRELFEAVSELHLTLNLYQPVHAALRPRLMLVGSVFLEFMAAKDSGGLAAGMAQVGRTVVEANQRELVAVQTLTLPLQRVMAAAARASLLPVSAVRDAALRLGEVVGEAGQAYGADSLWQPRKAAAARERADAAMFAALRDLVDAANAHLHPQASPRQSWLSRIFGGSGDGRPDSAALPASAAAPREDARTAEPTSAAAAAPGRQPGSRSTKSGAVPAQRRRRPWSAVGERSAVKVSQGPSRS